MLSSDPRLQTSLAEIRPGDLDSVDPDEQQDTSGSEDDSVYATPMDSCWIIGFIVFLPLIGHATWHAYRDVVDASEWPENEKY